jgi:WS/DGAT/MGAT family acyltransferase
MVRAVEQKGRLMGVREPMSTVDHAWLRMDRPSNLMMICGILVFRERVDFDRLCRTITERFLRYPRFRQRVVRTPAATFWEDDDQFELGRHVRRIGLPGDGGRAELQTLVSDLVATPLDPGKPMWEFHVVDNFDGGSAIVCRIHHCYADGIALIRVMLSMTDSDAKGTPATPAPKLRRRREPGTFEAILGPLSNLARTTSRWGGLIIAKGAEIWSDPAKAVALAERGSTFAAELLKLATMDQDSRTPFKGSPGVTKRVAWARPIPLGEVKAVGRALDCSINDVLLSSVAGALGGYLRAHGTPVDGVTIRAAVPVNLRPPEEAIRLGNRFGLVLLDLPVGIDNPVARLYQVRANMQALKNSVQPVLTLALLAALGAAPKLLQDQILDVLSRNATAVMTNVPGPQQPLWMAGAKLETLMFWVPQSGDIGMGVSILSYDGKVQFGVVSDRRLCPDPEDVIRRFAPEFEKLLYIALLAPWEGTLAPDAAEFLASGTTLPRPAGRRPARAPTRRARAGGHASEAS